MVRSSRLLVLLPLLLLIGATGPAIDWSASDFCELLFMVGTSTATANDDQCTGAQQGGADDPTPVGDVSCNVSATDAGLTGSPFGETVCSFDGADDDFNLPADFNTSGDDRDILTGGCWVSPDVADTAVVVTHGNAVGSTGWQIANLFDLGATLDLRSQVDGTAEDSVGLVATGANWNFVASTWNDPSDNTIVPALTGSVSANSLLDCTDACSTQATQTQLTNPWRWGRDIFGNLDLDGQLYECWLIDGALNAVSLCGICTCGFRNSANFGGRWEDLCKSCVLATGISHCGSRRVM